MNNFRTIRVWLFVVLFSAICSTACTMVINPPKQRYTAYAPQEKIDLNIGLIITDDFKQAKWEKYQMGDTWIIPVGEWLAPNSVTLANHVFANVVDLPEGSHVPDLTIDAVVIPKLVFINRSQGASSFGQNIITVKVEWELRTPLGKPIWVETVSGEASGTGWKDPEKVLEEALHRLQKNAQKAFISSQAIERFAATR